MRYGLFDLLYKYLVCSYWELVQGIKKESEESSFTENIFKQKLCMHLNNQYMGQSILFLLGFIHVSYLSLSIYFLFPSFRCLLGSS